MGADITSQGKDGSTALHSAIEHKLPKVLEALVKKCPEAVSIADKHGNQPLWTAAFNARGDYEMVEMLLECGADPEHLNKVSLTPLDIPKRKGEPALLQLLESKVVRKS
jgi:ankyrin repeat protein